MFLVISCLSAGLCLCGVVWVLARPAAQRAFAAGEFASHFLLHLAWPWVMALKPWCDPFLSWRGRAGLGRALRMAGLPLVWQAGHVLALQVVFFLFSLSVLLGVGALLAGLSPRMAFWCVAGALLLGRWPRWWIRRRGRQRQQRMLRELPFLLDMTTLCVEAGLNLQGALQQAASHGPQGPLRQELEHALADIRAGMPRVEALSALAARSGLTAVASLVAALAQAEQTGSSLAPLLRAQSDQRRAERFLRAEELAQKAPVKMLFPLVSCIFPCTFLIIGFPIVHQILVDAG